MKIEQEIMEMFDELMKSDYDYYNFEQYEVDGLKDFISHIITLVQKREREEIVERIEKEIKTAIEVYGCSFPPEFLKVIKTK